MQKTMAATMDMKLTIALLLTLTENDVSIATILRF